MIHCWSGTDKALHAALNLEIRFHKLTFTTVKASCPLFKQRTLAVGQKVKNLTSLIDSQLDLKALADVNDLESAIIASNESSEINFMEVNEDDAQGQALSIDASWPPRAGDYVIGAFVDGAYPGEVCSVNGGYANCDFMVPAELNGVSGRSLRK